MSSRIDNKAFAKIARIPQLLISAFLGFSVFVFATVNTCQLNKMSFDFSVSAFLPYVFLPFAVSAGLVWIILMVTRLLNRRLFMVMASALFGLGIAFYVQGNFLCVNNAVMMGDEPVWTSLMGPAVINLAIWFGIVLSMICFSLIKTRLFLKVSAIASALLLVMECGSIIVTPLLTQSTTYSNRRAYTTVKDQYTVSDNGDILVFLLDAFDTRNMQVAIDEYPEWLESFSDFTYYPNTACTYQRTDPSTVNMLSGQRYYNQIPFYDWCDDSLMNAPLFSVLKEHGFTINFYGVSDNLFPATMAKISDNMLPVEAKITHPYSFMYTMMRMTLYKFGPFVLQPFMYGDYAELFRRDYDMTAMKASGNERVVYDRLIENGGFDVKEEGRYFKFYHLQGAHSPDDLDRYGNPTSNGTTQERALGSLYLVGKILNELKEKGTYDKSMIIILADHGYQVVGNVLNVCNPIFMTKYPGQRGEGSMMQINPNVQVLLEDLAATCLDGAGIDYTGLGEPAANWVGRNRERFFYAYRYLFPTLNGDFYLDTLQEYRVPEDARDLDQYVLTGNSY